MGLAETTRALPGVKRKALGDQAGFPADRERETRVRGRFDTGEKENSRGEDPFARRVGVRTISFSFFYRHLIRGAALHFAATQAAMGGGTNRAARR